MAETPNPQPARMPSSAPAEFVTVACKLPAGIHLDVFRMDEYQEHTVMGVRTGQRAVRTARYTVKGIGRRLDDPRLNSGFALTPGIPKMHWEAWLNANQDTPLVKNGIIFAHRAPESVASMAKEREKNVSGFEPVDPRAIPREFRGKIETAERP
jgi:hypothetical protein